MRKADATTARFESYASGWRNITGMSDEQTVELVRQDQIDILVDLAGHTSGSKLMVFACKPAPIQITYLGYPDTTGLSTMDYRLTDALADPPGTTEEYHTEKLLRLPECFLSFAPPADAPDVAPLPALTMGHVTFGCFNVLGKINPQLVEWWSRILQGVPGSRMMLKTRGLADPGARQRLLELFQYGGVSPDRIELRNWTKTRQEHLESFGQIDIALDTYPYNGTTITCEALWMGVPVITLAGQTHVSRVGASILTNAKLSKLVAKTPDEYVGLAIQIAGKQFALAKTRAGLRGKLSASALTDGKRFAGQVEALYRQVWETWCLEQG
jgi:predicted O-linked N-acetylglucosamine transferase (SPINDLY family)